MWDVVCKFIILQTCNFISRGDLSICSLVAFCSSLQLSIVESLPSFKRKDEFQLLITALIPELSPHSSLVHQHILFKHLLRCILSKHCRRLLCISPKQFRRNIPNQPLSTIRKVPFKHSIHRRPLRKRSTHSPCFSHIRFSNRNAHVHVDDLITSLSFSKCVGKSSLADLSLWAQDLTELISLRLHPPAVSYHCTYFISRKSRRFSRASTYMFFNPSDLFSNIR